MDIKLKNYLKIRYSMLFNQNNKVYMSLGDGWFSIVNNCLDAIQIYINEIKNNNAIYEEMEQAVNSMDTESVNKYYLEEYLNNNLKCQEVPEFNIVEMKEKFGGLHILGHGKNDVIRKIVSYAEMMSYETCEICGNRGKVRNGSWIKVLCDEHNNGLIENEVMVDKFILVAELDKLTRVKIVKVLDENIVVRKLDDENEVIGEYLSVEQITNNGNNYYIFK